MDMRAFSDLQSLHQVEERLRREQEECERLEAQIRALASNALASTAPTDAAANGGDDGGTAPRPATSTYGVTPTWGGAPFAPAAVGDRPTVPPRPTATATPTTSSALPPPLPPSPSRTGTPNKHSTPGAHAATPGGSNGAGMVGGGHDTLTTASTGRPAAPVTYRSPIYRSASPSRRVGGDKVVVSNFGRSPRFREEKTWVPGPGQYHPSESEFTPVTVVTKRHDATDPGRSEHTWEGYDAAVGNHPSPRKQHELAMASAALATSVRTALPVSKETALASTATSTGSGSDSAMDGTAVGHAAEVLLHGAGGSAKAALEASVRRERALRREIESLTKQMNAQRLAHANTTGQLRSEVEAERNRVQRAKAQAAVVSSKLHAMEQAWGVVDGAFAALKGGVNGVGNAWVVMAGVPPDAITTRIPAMAALVDQVTGLEASLQRVAQALGPAVAAARGGSWGGEVDVAPVEGAPPAAIGKGAGTPTPPTSPSYLGYSSLMRAMSRRQEMGSLGASASYLDSNASPTAMAALHAASTPAKAASSRPGGGDGGGGMLVKEGAVQSIIPSPSTPVDVTAKGISGGDVMSFARRARRQSEVVASEERGRAAVVAAASAGFDVGLVQSLAAAQTEAAVAALTEEQEAAVRAGRKPPSPSHGPGSVVTGGGGSVVGGGAPRPVGLSATVSAAVGRARSPAAAGGGGGGAPSKASAPVLRRMSMAMNTGAASEVPAVLPISPIPEKEATIADRLQQIFKYYSLYGDRDSDGTTLRSQQFRKLILDSGAMTPMVGEVPLSQADVDMAFTRAATAGGASARSSASATAAGAHRLSFEPFVTALNELAVRRYKGASAVGEVATGGDLECFRQFVQEYVLTIYARLKTDALFVFDVAAMGSEELATKFAAEFTTPEVLGFFNEHRAALQSIFSTYALADRRLGDRPSTGVSGPMALSARMSRKALLQWATDFKVVPDMLSRPEFLALHRECSRTLGRPESEDLGYADWVELVGMLAFALGDSRFASERSTVIASLGVVGDVSMLTKLHLLFHNMYEHGARFLGEADRMIRVVTRHVRAEVERATAQQARMSAAMSNQQRKKVGEVLTESVYM